MEDQDLDSREEEVAPQETELNESEQSEPVENESASSREAEEDKNWRAMRQRQKELEWELQKRDEYIKGLMQPQQAQKHAEPEEPDIPDDEFTSAGIVKKITGKTVKPLEKKIQELEEKIAQTEQERKFNSLKSKYPDFDDVVNIETLELLEKHDRELAETIAAIDDPYKKWASSYKYIKALNLVDKLPNARRKKEVEKKLEKNAKTVQSPQAFDKRPMAQAYKMTQADQTRLYEEMMYYASKANGL